MQERLENEIELWKDKEKEWNEYLSKIKLQYEKDISHLKEKHIGNLC